MKSIQTKFIALILACVLTSSFVIGGAGILSAKRVVDEDSARYLNLLCSEKAQSIDAQLSHIEQSVNTLALYATNKLGSVEHLISDDEYAEEYTRLVQEVALNAANNTEGALAVYLRFNPEFGRPTSGLFWSKTTLNGSFQEMIPTDFSRYKPEDIEHVGWYYIPVKNGKPTWMAPYMNQNINVEMISYVVPLYVDNTTVGVIGMDIDFSILKDFVDTTRIYESGYAFLTDSKANVMYHKDIPASTAIESTSDSLRSIAEELQSSSGGKKLSHYRWNHEKKQMTFCKLRNGMRFAVTVPTVEIDRAKNALIMQIIIAFIVIAAVFVFFTVHMTKRMIRPLKELNIAAQKIAAGDLSIAITNQTKDEVGTLADSFQQTVNHLQKYIEYINGLAYRDALTNVKNRTSYLETAEKLDKQTQLGRPEFAVVVFDINGLKEVNDTLGHDFGDMVIIDCCKIICRTFRHSAVYRIGGDEFVTILENDDYKHYHMLLERFETAVEEFNQYTKPDGRISIARGIALYEEDTDLTFGDVFKRADEGMYQNKVAMKKQKSEEQIKECEKQIKE